MKLKKPLRQDKSYIIFVDTYGEGELRVLYHMPNSDLVKFMESEIKGKVEAFYDSPLDEESIFNYNGLKGGLNEILLALIGDRMGYWGETTDYNYTITQVNSIHEIHETGEKDNPYSYAENDNILEVSDEDE